MPGFSMALLHGLIGMVCHGIPCNAMASHELPLTDAFTLDIGQRGRIVYWRFRQTVYILPWPEHCWRRDRSSITLFSLSQCHRCFINKILLKGLQMPKLSSCKSMYTIKCRVKYTKHKNLAPLFYEQIREI